jgi:hypothetical protein
MQVDLGTVVHLVYLNRKELVTLPTEIEPLRHGPMSGHDILASFILAFAIALLHLAEILQVMHHSP